ncbi:MAG: LysR substrate-binding domain-containing protein, partial [Bacteroidota bacterium]|nr:LysR substrate-binding domain-containing protein [Bacteroidota bacterium]
MSISIIQMKYAVAVYNHRNFSIAAEKCFITQPTLSMQITKLEKDLGILIFNRKKHPIGITKAGEKFINQAKVVITEYGRLEELVKYGNDDYSGVFRLGIIPTISPYLLPLFLNLFSEKLPEVDLVINELTTAEIITGLRKDVIDAGILALPLKQNDISELTLYYEPFVAFVPESHPLFKKKYLAQGELPFDDILLLKEGHCFRNQVISLCGGNAVNKARNG